jgi:2Fe-2S iron-sulfur cluster protein
MCRRLSQGATSSKASLPAASPFLLLAIFFAPPLLCRDSSWQLAVGIGERLITLNVNGQQRRVDVMKQETLASTLRYKLGLAGTKLGCDRAECGSCTVLIDDIPHYSCSVLTHTVRGRKVLTIEGLASADGTLHPVQRH